MNRWDPRFGLAWHPMERFVIRSGFALTHIDMRAGFLYTDELMTDSTNISQATGNPTPLFNLDSGVRGDSSTRRAAADGSVPYRGNPGGHSASIVRSEHAGRLHHELELRRPVPKLHRDYMVEVQYKGSAQVRNSGSYNLNTRPWAMIPNPNGSGLMNLNDPANAAFRNTWLEQHAGFTALEQLGRHQLPGQQRPPHAP